MGGSNASYRLFIAFGSVSKYAEGPAVVRASERISITVPVPGVVSSVDVQFGKPVLAGDVLVALHSVEELAQVASIEREFESALVQMLADPLNQSARQTVASLQSQKTLLSTRLNQRKVRAPAEGIVGDIRVRVGQAVSPGDILVSIAQSPQRYSVTALLPGRQRPELSPGQTLRLELTGYAYVYHDLVIDQIDDVIVGPQEVRRILGSDVADSITVGGPVVVVNASLPATSFESGGRIFQYFDGMHGTARAKIRSERIITMLAPSIRIVTERNQ